MEKKNQKAQGSGALGSAYVYKPTEIPPCPKADWNTWKYIPKATLQDAIFLSLNLEPFTTVGDWFDYEQPGNEFNRRMKIALAHIGATGPLRTLDKYFMRSPEMATVSLNEFAQWAISMSWELPELFPKNTPPVAALLPEQTHPAPTVETVTPAPVALVVPATPAPDDVWKTKARERAAELISEARARDRYPSQVNLGDAIAKEFRSVGIMGVDGKPITGAYIKRHALRGISSAQGKQLSTSTKQGKQGK